MTTKPSGQEPSFEEITKALYKRFWILATILVVANALIAVGGKQLVEYRFKEYMESKLSEWDDVIDRAKADATAASQLARNANDAASRAVDTADSANSTVDTAKLKVDALAKRLDHFDAQLTELSDLGVQINKAKMALGDFQALQKQIDQFKDSEAMTTKIAWKTIALKNVTDTEHVFEFDNEVLDAIAFISLVNARARASNWGDLKFGPGQPEIQPDKRKVKIRFNNYLKDAAEGRLEDIVVHVIARVRIN